MILYHILKLYPEEVLGGFEQVAQHAQQYFLVFHAFQLQRGKGLSFANEIHKKAFIHFEDSCRTWFCFTDFNRQMYSDLMLPVAFAISVTDSEHDIQGNRVIIKSSAMNSQQISTVMHKVTHGQKYTRKYLLLKSQCHTEGHSFWDYI